MEAENKVNEESYRKIIEGKFDVINKQYDYEKYIKEERFTPNSFILRNVFSKEECNYYINEGEKLGYKPITGYFTKSYRDNLRIQVLHNKLADELWRRVKKYVPEQIILNGTEVALGNDCEGTWKQKGLNPLFRFCKYEPGGHFGAHMDGNFVSSENEMSLYTIMLYLNGDF